MTNCFFSFSRFTFCLRFLIVCVSQYRSLHLSHQNFWASWILCQFLSSYLVSLQSLFLQIGSLPSFSFPSGTLIMLMLFHMMVFHKFLSFSWFFFILVSSCSSARVILKDLYSISLILSSFWSRIQFQNFCLGLLHSLPLLMLLFVNIMFSWLH